ncbi:MAG: hypothetical protein J0H10_09755 [Alphaproteobacteria bacterium]|jgi:hypothetical protein|nr:hypothetical protein [Alphaproteobacteria bacterium]
MTNTSDITPEPNPPLSDWELKSQAHAKLEAEVFKQNKAALLDALAVAGITAVIVSFDGYGDSGQIENVEVLIGDDEARMPAGTIEIGEALWGEVELKRSAVGISAAVESLAYDVLEQTHAGWENNDGAYGDIVFDVAERTIALDYNERYTASENYTHRF